MLHLHLSREGSYRPGSVVSGRVALSSRNAKGESVNTQSISLVFTGRCTTKNGSLDASAANHGNVILYTHERTLFTGPSTLHAPFSSSMKQDREPHSWPFEFMVPLHCSLAQSPHFVKDVNFDDDKDQPLPFTFSDHDPDPEGVHYGLILHELTATLTTFKKKLFSSTPRKLQVSQPLDLINIPPIMVEVPPRSVPPSNVGWYRSKGDFFPIEPPRTRPRMIMGVSKPNHVSSPNADFVTQIHLPPKAQIGHTIPVSMSLQQNTEPSTSTSHPEVLLRRLSLQLQTVTLVRGSYGKALENTQRDTHRWDSTQTVLSSAFGPPLKLTESALDLRSCADLTFRPNVLPSFKTFNVARQYYISATFMIVVDGKTNQPTSTARMLIDILGRGEENSVREKIEGPGEIGANRSVVEEQLPAYKS